MQGSWHTKTEALHGANCKLGFVMLWVAGLTSFGMLGTVLQTTELFCRFLHA